jgi:adenylyltransferase/sulfurtransferase
VLAILPHRTACLRCLWEEPPPPGTLPTCDTAGVLAAAVNIVASLQATEAMKILIGDTEGYVGHGGPTLRAWPMLRAVDAWAGRIRALNVQAAFDEGDCPCCKQGRYDFLAGDKASATTTLCGRDAVQILPGDDVEVSFRAIADRLPPRSNAKHNEFMLRFSVVVEGEGGVRRATYGVTVFGDGRAIVQGTSDPATARAVYAKYVGV